MAGAQSPRFTAEGIELDAATPRRLALEGPQLLGADTQPCVSPAAAALGIVSEIEWFMLVDQTVTGRWLQGCDGEHANSGVPTVPDRPWKKGLEEAMRTNDTIYDGWLGKRAPLEWSDPRLRDDALNGRCGDRQERAVPDVALLSFSAANRRGRAPSR